jgi:hypothetical protein
VLLVLGLVSEYFYATKNEEMNYDQYFSDRYQILPHAKHSKNNCAPTLELSEVVKD